MRIRLLLLVLIAFSSIQIFSQSDSAVDAEGKARPETRRAEEQFILFELHECKKSGSTVECDLTVTNKGEDRRFQISKYQTKLSDEDGNTYRCSQFRFAAEIDPGTRDFVAGVKAKVRLSFSKIVPGASQAKRLEISFGAGNPYPKNTVVKFREVPLKASR